MADDKASSLAEVAKAIASLRKRWGLTHHAAVHLLRLVGEVGGRTTSGRRTAVQNRRVGGRPRSRHLVGAAWDHVPSRGVWEHALAFARSDRCGPECRGPEDVLDERDHIHWEDRPGVP